MGNKASQLNAKQLADALTPDEIRRFTNAFYIFDQAGNGAIGVKQIGTIMKTLGYELSNSEMSTMLERAKVKKTATLKQLLSMQAMRAIEQQVKEKLVVAYKNFEKCGSNQINIDDLRETMASFHGDISPDKIEEIVREAMQGEGENVRCDEFIRVVAGK